MRLRVLLLPLFLFPTFGVAAKKTAPEIPTTHVSCKGGPREIRVVVTNVRKNEGLITVDLYRNAEEGFLKKAGRVARARYAAKAPVTLICLAAPSEEPHAIAVYQDRNANKKFDKGALGLPAEPYGLSNNPKMRFAPPKVGEALFHVPTEGATVEIVLKN
jgi:uncharacterized protein (DUF2141 family)